MANKGYALTNDNNQVLDGSGAALASPCAFSSIWYHDGEVTTTISTQEIFTKITHFVNEGEEDGNSNVVGDATTDDDLTIGANGAGKYELGVQASFRNASGVNKDMKIGVKITLATPRAIASSTDATPIVATTSLAHGLKTGDMVTITGHATNTALNTDCLITKASDTTFSVQTLGGTDIAGSGGGAGSGGNVVAIYPGNILLERSVAGSQIGRGAALDTYSLAASDTLEAHIANTTDTNNAVFTQIALKAKRLI